MFNRQEFAGFLAAGLVLISVAVPRAFAQESGRPWVTISDIVTMNDLVFDDAGSQVPISYKLENEGSAPAFGADPFFSDPGGLKAEPLPPPEEARKMIDCGKEPPPSGIRPPVSDDIGTAILPGAKTDTRDTVLSTGKYINQGFPTEVWAPFCIRYKDEKGDDHATGFLMVFSPAGGGEDVLPASTVKGTFEVVGRGYVIY